MSGIERLKKSLNLPWTVLGAVAGWLVVAPLTAVIPKRHDWIAVIGRQDGRFLDNAKYFFLQASQEATDLHFVFVSERPSVVNTLNNAHVHALRYPSWRGVMFLARCGTAVVDEASWYRKFRAFLLIRAHVVQLWHGVGTKWVEAGLWAHESGSNAWASRRLPLLLRLGAYRITRRRIRYAAVATTSRFYRDEVFAPTFLARAFPLTGYPRNDFGLSLRDRASDVAWSNVDDTIASTLPEWQRLGRKLVLIAPTFRKSGAEPMRLDNIALAMIDAFAEANGVEFLFKFHPSECNVDAIAGRHFHVCTRDSDVYPLFPSLSALVSDYSSISMDFLLVDKPLLFLIADDDSYAHTDQELQFDPCTMMPGPVVSDWPSLLGALLAEWAHDAHAEERAALRRKAFDDLPQAEAVPKLLAFMREQNWIVPNNG